MLTEPEKIPCAFRLSEGCLNFVLTLEKTVNNENEPPMKLPETPFCDNCGEFSKGSRSSKSNNFNFGVSNDFSSKRGSRNEATWSMRDKCNRQKSELKKKLCELENFEESESSSEYIERIAKDIFSNIEENFEIKQSLSEIEDLMRVNISKMRLLEQRILAEYDAIELSSMEDELESLRDVHSENQEIHEKLHSALKVNQNQKDILADLIIKFSEENRNSARATEISLLKHQLANLELTAANHELLSEIHCKSKRVTELEYLTSPSTHLASNSSLLFKSYSRSKPNSGIKRSDEPIVKKEIFMSGRSEVEKLDFRRPENKIHSQEIACRPRELCVEETKRFSSHNSESSKSKSTEKKVLYSQTSETFDLDHSDSSEKSNPNQISVTASRLNNIESFCEGEVLQLESDSPKLQKTSRNLFVESNPMTMMRKERPRLSEEECVLVDSSVEEIMRH